MSKDIIIHTPTTTSREDLEGVHAEDLHAGDLAVFRGVIADDPDALVAFRVIDVTGGRGGYNILVNSYYDLGDGVKRARSFPERCLRYRFRTIEKSG